MNQTTTRSLRKMKQKGDKIVMITAYDYTFAKIFDEAGADIILVGDSLANVIQGRDTTLPVTLEEMIYHTRCVARGVKSALVVIDLPFLTFQVSEEDALRNAGRAMKESGAQAVKLEGGSEMAPTVERLTRAGIPVMGHVGLTPQSVHQLGGYRVQGKKEKEARRLLESGKTLQKAGAFALVLECTPAELAGAVSEELSIPTIGIGAGPRCDGQVLVMHDLLGLTLGPTASFVKRYAELAKDAAAGACRFIEEVRGGSYPDESHSY